ncbi:MAG: DNA primase [Candidatus Eisenbacteria bacterium RBG_16_71_46]|nr:MAG: DNA primase [Candidatus Eisenbacteria bacterium RBG_16_71_46]
MNGTLTAPGSARARGPDDWVERVRAATDIVEYVGQTVALKRVGRNWVGLCPFHQEKTPSFSVNAERQFYHCFSCKAGGDVFTFVQETEHVGFVEAVEILSRRAGIPVPERHPGERGQRAPLLEALESAAAAYERWLADPERGAVARAHLERRGLARDTVRAFRLGYAPEGWEHLAQGLRGKVTEEVLVQAGLAARRESGRGGVYDRFRHRLMVPLVAPGGGVVGFGARALAEGDQPKYLNSPETAVYHKGSFLFGFEQARRGAASAGEMIVVEGYFDAIALHQAGLTHTVATSGTALTADHARLLKRVVTRAVLAYDGDAAGREAIMRSLGILLAAGLEVVVVDLPEGEDPDSLVQRGGAGAWAEARRRAADPVEFIQRHLLRAGGPGDPRERALQAVVGLGAGLGDPVRVRLLLERAAQVFGFSETALARAVGLRRSGQDARRPVEALVAERRRGEHELERRLLQALLQHPAGLEDARAVLGPADFHDPACAALAQRLWSGGGEGPDAEAAAALERELAATSPELPDWPEQARVTMRAMAARRLREGLKERQQELRRADSEVERARLMREIQEIGRSLRNLNT